MPRAHVAGCSCVLEVLLDHHGLEAEEDVRAEL